MIWRSPKPNLSETIRVLARSGGPASRIREIGALRPESGGHSHVTGCPDLRAPPATARSTVSDAIPATPPSILAALSPLTVQLKRLSP